jgi:hypothetical protein
VKALTTDANEAASSNCEQWSTTTRIVLEPTVHDARMRTVCSTTACWALLKIDHELLSRCSDHVPMVLHSIVRPGMDCKTVRISIFTNRDRGGCRGVYLCRSMLEGWGDGCSHALHTLTANKSYPASMLPKLST